MNHQIAVDSRAAERYLLDEMDAAARAAFEEHFFCCRLCAAEVRMTAAFADNARALLLEGVAPAPMWMRPAWVPAALAACLIAGYFAPHKPSPDPPGSAEVLTATAVPAGPRGAQRAAARTVAVAPRAAHFLLQLDIGDDIRASRLRWEIRDAAGRTIVSLAGGNQPQTAMLLRAADFRAGQYEAELRADQPGAPVIDRYPFTIQFE